MRSQLNTQTGIIPWFARNPVAANILMLALILGGVYSAFTVKKELMPPFVFDSVTIEVAYLGAAPQEVEEGVILKIEDAIEDVEGIKEITSIASEGLASVNVAILGEYQPLAVLEQIKLRVDAISNLPENTEKPIIYRPKFVQPAINVAIYGNATEQQLKSTAKQLRETLIQHPSITLVELVGARDDEISIELSEAALLEHQLSLQQISNGIRRSSLDLPGGQIRSSSGNILLRSKGQAYQVEDFSAIPIRTNSDGTRLLLGDIAIINDGFVEGLGIAKFNGKPSLSLAVKAVGDEDTLEIANAVKQRVSQWQQTTDSSINVSVWADATHYLDDRLNSMLDNIGFGALLVLLVLILFLNLRLAFWVTVGIPVCFLGTLLLMPQPAIDVSVNMISLFAFILVLGVIVDDAIIMGESAYSEVEQHGHSVDNVIRGVQRVALPATMGVVTTIIFFIPLIIMDGLTAALIEPIGWVVILCLVFSLVESKLILPAHLAHMRQQQASDKPTRWQKLTGLIDSQLKSFVANRYGQWLEYIIHYRYQTLSIFLAIAIVFIGLFSGGVLRFVFLPDLPSDFIQANLTMQKGASPQQRDETLALISSALRETDAQVTSDYGSGVVQNYLTFSKSAIEGGIFLELKKGEKPFDSREISRIWRNNLPSLTGVEKFEIVSDNGVFTQRGDVSFLLRGDDLSSLQSASEALANALRDFSGVQDVTDNFSSGGSELQFAIKPEAEFAGLRLDTIAQQIRAGFYGIEAQRLQRNDEEVKVMVRYPKSTRSSFAELQTIHIRDQSNTAIPLSTVASITMAPAYASIVRVNGERAVSLNATVDKTQVEPQRIIADLQAELIPALKISYPNVSITIGGSSEEQQDMLLELSTYMAIALLTIYILMAVVLRSYSQPIMIMSVIPLGVIGAIIGHTLLGYSLSFISFFGIVALSGVVVNDSLILVDCINKAHNNKPLEVAVIQGCKQRFRAIVLTSITTFIGLIPILLEDNLQAQSVIPMAISLGFGILFATTLTLILLPALYMVVDDIKRGLYRHFLAPWRLLSRLYNPSRNK